LSFRADAEAMESPRKLKLVPTPDPFDVVVGEDERLTGAEAKRAEQENLRALEAAIEAAYR
jgi:hypothetical protein